MVASTEHIDGCMECPEAALSAFQGGFYCSEAILKTFNQHYQLGLTEDHLRLATGFGTGLGGARCCCGCLTSGVAILSLVAGRSQVEASAEPALQAAAELHHRFKKQFKATCCRVLTRRVLWGSPGHHRHCEQYVQGASVLIEQILGERFGVYPQSS